MGITEGKIGRMNPYTRILVLDDDKGRHRAFQHALIGTIMEHVYTAEEAIRMLESHPWDIFFCDHDLGDKVMVASGKGTGYEVAEWLRDNPHRMPKQIIVHSFNPVGAQNIKNVLPSAELVPGAWTLLRTGQMNQ